MACLVGSLAPSIACCFGSAACSLCCRACPTCKNSSSSRIAYAMLMLGGTVVACLLLIPQVHGLLEKIPGLCSLDQSNCQYYVGYSAVYRVCFAMACFFFLMAVVMIKVKSSRDPRSAVQNGFWFFKILIIVGICIGAFFIKDDSSQKFGTAWMVIGMIGAFLFILIQLVLLIDFAHGWSEKWLDRYEETQSKKWFAGLLGFTIFFYLLSLVMVILFYVFYAKDSECSIHKFFVSFNLILCVIVSVVSVLPVIQDVNPKSGLLQSSVITAYVMYLTWSAMSNNPNKKCNPSFFDRISNSTGTPSIDNDNQEITFDWKSLVSLVLFIGCVLYSSIRSSSVSGLSKLTSSSSVDDIYLTDNTDDDVHLEDGEKVYDDEKENVAYNYSFFHLMLFLASLYIMMVLTHWYKPSSNFSMSSNEPAMWVKIASSWTCIVLYTWTIVAPVVLCNREFN